MRSLIAAALMMGAAAAGAAPDARLEDVVTCVRANLPERTAVQTAELTSTGVDGSKQRLRTVMYARGGTESREAAFMLDLRSPADVAGSRYLLLAKPLPKDDEMYVYLPGLQRTRRILGGMKGQALWGTDFSYEDVKQLQGSLLGNETRLLAPDSIDGRAVHTLEVSLSEHADSAYRKAVVWVDEQTCLALKAEFYDASGLSKRLTADPKRFVQVDERWVAMSLEMVDVRAQSRTTMELSDVRYDERLSRIIFNPRSFQLAN